MCPDDFNCMTRPMIVQLGAQAKKGGVMSMMKRLSATVLLIGLLALCGCGTMDSTDAYFRNSKSKANVYVSKMDDSVAVSKVAILPFHGPTELVGSSVSDMFLTEVMRAGCFKMVERGQMSKVLGETELALAGLSSAKAIEAGQMIGADAVIIGTVDEYSMVPVRGETYPVMGVSIRMIECQSGKVLWSVDLAERSREKGMTLSEHSRSVIHKMASSLYQQWKKQGYSNRK